MTVEKPGWTGESYAAGAACFAAASLFRSGLVWVACLLFGIAFILAPLLSLAFSSPPVTQCK